MAKYQNQNFENQPLSRIRLPIEEIILDFVTKKRKDA